MKKWLCQRCGYIHLGGGPPRKCPVCGAPAAEFKEIGVSDAPFWRRLLPPVFLHPIAVHLPIALIPVALLFLIFSAIFQSICVEETSFYLLLIALLAAPGAAAAGYYDWKTRYHTNLTYIFKIKLAGSAVLIILLLIIVVWRLVNDFAHETFVYYLLILAAIGVTAVLGHYGGVLVFGRLDRDET